MIPATRITSPENSQFRYKVNEPTPKKAVISRLRTTTLNIGIFFISLFHLA